MLYRLLKLIVVTIVASWLVGVYALPIKPVESATLVSQPKLVLRDKKADLVSLKLDNQALFVELSDQYALTRLQTKLVQAQIKHMQAKIALIKLNRTYALLATSSNTKQKTLTNVGKPDDTVKLVTLSHVGDVWQAEIKYRDMYHTIGAGQVLFGKWQIDAVGPQGVFITYRDQSFLLSFNQLITTGSRPHALKGDSDQKPVELPKRKDVSRQNKSVTLLGQSPKLSKAPKPTQGPH